MIVLLRLHRVKGAIIHHKIRSFTPRTVNKEKMRLIGGGGGRRLWMIGMACACGGRTKRTARAVVRLIAMEADEDSLRMVCNYGQHPARECE